MNKLFLPNNKTAPISGRTSTQSNMLVGATSLRRSSSHLDGFLEKRQDEQNKRHNGFRSARSARRPQTAPHIVENNFF